MWYDTQIQMERRNNVRMGAMVATLLNKLGLKPNEIVVVGMDDFGTLSVAYWSERGELIRSTPALEYHELNS